MNKLLLLLATALLAISNYAMQPSFSDHPLKLKLAALSAVQINKKKKESYTRKKLGIISIKY